ncbi:MULTISPECIES: flagellar motor switch protein FliG [Methylocaldum]|jgi:flagellar motor switch protein FliG|uniref:flagellar motor switch protein FliG n=1 Tax=unclassified Methylocaldum TaxID=2622260 RepID=UPI00098ACD7A|nr:MULTISPECIES: flagellar motor switch protein FliG [unclassified Methylocaldum]MBP1150434.1 flagellar motor switch protein FliG [Methylocaldum sp. RMAD-M]MVF23547.1 flagellar motor switch protein FliG [Methylocaldum sp. BRCS4]
MAEAESSRLDGPQRAALFFLTVGQDRAAEVLKHMSPKEVQQIGAAMAELRNITMPMVEDVLGKFVDDIRNQTALGVNSEEYIRNLLTQALGADKASSVCDRILLGRNSKGLEQLKWMDPRAIADLIRLEHPQIIAIILSLLDSDQAAETLGYLPERARPDLIMRVATLTGVQPAALRELDDIMERQLSGNANVKSSTLGGIETAANILNFIESTVEASIMEQISEVNPDLSQKIQDKMFVFDDLVDIDDRGIQTLLREVSTDSLLLALRGADDALKEKIFSNMSRRAAEMLRDDLEAAPPARLSEVEAAQKDILAIARRMAEAGELSLGGSDELI